MIKTSNLMSRVNASSQGKISSIIKSENNKNTQGDTFDNRNSFLPNSLLITKNSNLTVSFNERSFIDLRG